MILIILQNEKYNLIAYGLNKVIMNPTFSYKAFDTNKSYGAVIYDATIWIDDLDFFKIEMLFLKAIIKSNLFKSQIPNLFERLQLLIIEVDQFIEDNDVLNEQIKLYSESVERLIKSDVFSLEDDYLDKYHNLAEEVLLFTQKYKNFKMSLYEFITELI